MRAKTDESPGIKSKMDDVAEAVAAVKRDLIEVLPKMRRAGRTDVSDLKVSVNAAGLGAPLRRGVSTGGCRGGLLPRCTCAYSPWAGATSCGLPRSSDCVGFCVAFPQEPSFSRRKTRLCVVLLGELSHSCKEWQSEAGGGKTFCLSAFLEVVGLGRFLICQSLPPPATNPYVAFYVAFYVTPQKRTLTTTSGQKDSNHHRQLARWVGST